MLAYAARSLRRHQSRQPWLSRAVELLHDNYRPDIDAMVKIASPRSASALLDGGVATSGQPKPHALGQPLPGRPATRPPEPVSYGWCMLPGSGRGHRGLRDRACVHARDQPALTQVA